MIFIIINDIFIFINYYNLMQFLSLKFVCVKNADIRLKLFIAGQSAAATQ